MSQYRWNRENRHRRSEAVHRHYAKRTGQDPEECRKPVRTDEERRAINLAGKARYRAENRDQLSTLTKAYYATHVAERREYAVAYRIKNLDRVAAQQKNWRQQNAARVAANSDKRLRARREATPPWLTAIEHAKIQAAYDAAIALTMQTGIVYEVDHIHPLQGKGFRGLHVPWNLQVIPKADNRRKTNRLGPP